MFSSAATPVPAKLCMDKQAIDATQRHYDSHANRHLTSQEAERARRAGGAFQLKKFHNDIKRALINRFASGKVSLLDLACGRGGDIRKWSDAGLKKVKGIDLSPQEIVEARKRFDELLQQQPGLQLRAEFVASPELGLSEWKEPQQYDAVTCMFAIHYFFVSEAALRQLLQNVVSNLKDGGYFFGTVPDGKRVLSALNRRTHLDCPMLSLSAQTFCEDDACAKRRSRPTDKCAVHGQAAPAAFGSAYTCAIGDTVTAGHGDSQGSFEYLVYESVLKGVAKSVGLEPVNNYGMELDRFFDQADAGKMFKHFHPVFRDCDPSLATASALFMAFAFRKPPVAPPAAAPTPADAGPSAPRPTDADERAEVSGAGTAQHPPQQQQQQSEEQRQSAAESRKRAAPAAPATKRPTIRRRGGRPVDGGGPAPAAEQDCPGGT